MRKPQLVGTCTNCQVSFKFRQSRPTNYCSGLCSKAHKQTILVLEKEQYSASPKECKHCNASLTWEKRHYIFCDSKCAATFTNRTRTISSRAGQRETLCKTLSLKFDTKKPKDKKLKEGTDYCSILFSPITGVAYNPILKPPKEWDDPRSLNKAQILAEAFSFELCTKTTASSIIQSIEIINSMIWEHNMSPGDIKKKLNIKIVDIGPFLKRLGIVLRTRTEAINNYIEKNKQCRNDRTDYRNQCRFKFNPYDFSEIPGYELLLDRGIWSVDNQSGVTRDHMLSVEYGWRNGISADILAHPANCEFMSAYDNSKKNTSSSLSIDQLELRIKNNIFTKSVNEYIHLPKTEKTKRKISEAISNKQIITDGVINKYINKNELIPLGFRKGYTSKKQ